MLRSRPSADSGRPSASRRPPSAVRYTSARARRPGAFSSRQAGRSTAIQILKLAWQKWRAFAHVLGNFQARLLLTVFYFVFVGPIGLVLRWRTDPLKTRHPGPGSFWLERETRDLTLEDARRQS